MAETHSNVFRKEAIEMISSPEQLTDYLRVTNPGIWAVLIAVVLLLGGMLAWSCIGTLEASSTTTSLGLAKAQPSSATSRSSSSRAPSCAPTCAARCT